MEVLTTEFFPLTKIEKKAEEEESSSDVDMVLKRAEASNIIWLELLEQNQYPWELVRLINQFILGHDWNELGYRAIVSSVWIYGKTLISAKGLLKQPVVIGQNCTIGDTATIRPNVFVGENVTIGNGCIVKNSIIMDGAKLLGNNMLSDSIIGKDIVLGPGVNIVNQCAPVLSPGKFIKIAGVGEIQGLKRFGAIIGDGTNIAANVRINPGTVIGKNCFIESFDIRALVEHGIKVGLNGEHVKIRQD